MDLGIDEKIKQLIEQLYTTQIGNSFYGPSAQAQQKVPEELMAIATESPDSRDRVICVLIESLEYSAEGEDAAFRIVSNLLGKLKAVEAVDTLVKYLDYLPDNIGASLRRAPAVAGVIQIGESAIPKLEGALISGKSHLHRGKYLLRQNAVTALMHIGTKQAKEALERSRSQMKDKRIKDSIESAIECIDKQTADKDIQASKIQAADIGWVDRFKEKLE